MPIITKEPKWNKTETDNWNGFCYVTRTAWFSKQPSVREFEEDGWSFTDCMRGPSSWYKVIENSDDKTVVYRIYKRDGRWTKYGRIEEATTTRST